MGKLKITVVLCALAFFQVVYCDDEEALRLPQDEPESSQEEEEIQPETQIIKKPNVVTIDLSECTCTSMNSCELTVLKSPLMDISCGDQESLCCPMTKSAFPPTSEASNEEDEAEIAPRSNVRVYSITPTVINGASPSSETLSRKVLKSKKCACKTRGTCPHKYIDYGFGFYCTYNTVRCCIPEESSVEVDVASAVDSDNVDAEAVAPILNTTATQPEVLTDPALTTTADENVGILEVANDMTSSEIDSSVEGDSDAIMESTMDAEGSIADPGIPAVDSEANITTTFVEDFVPSESVEEAEQREGQAAEGELLITEVTNWSGLEEDEYQKEGDCFCLPIQKCRVAGVYDSNNMIERRRDTMCPGDLVQCCGKDVMDEMTKKRDDVAGEYEGAAPIKAEISEPVPDDSSQYEYSSPSDTYLTSNDTGYSAVPAVAQEVENLPPSSVLPVPYPGYQPPGYYKGYGNQYPTNSYPSGQQVSNNNYHRNGQQQQLAQNQYDSTGGQSYRPWMYSNYPPPLNNGQTHGGAYPPRNTYSENDTARHKSGGLFDTLSKLLG